MKSATPEKGSAKRWLTVSDDPSHRPIIGRWVDISTVVDPENYGPGPITLVNGETPLEDYPFWLLTDHPVTEDYAWKIWIENS